MGWDCGTASNLAVIGVDLGRRLGDLAFRVLGLRPRGEIGEMSLPLPASLRRWPTVGALD